jgi:hypothetical protein
MKLKLLALLAGLLFLSGCVAEVGVVGPPVYYEPIYIGPPIWVEPYYFHHSHYYHWAPPPPRPHFEHRVAPPIVRPAPPARSAPHVVPVPSRSIHSR